jgi:hypothetical protein
MNIQEKTFPIYSFSASWTQKSDEARKHNGTGFRKMFKEELTQEQLDNYIQEWWSRYSTSDNLKDKEVELLTLTAKYKEHEVWCLTWFGHETFDLGQTDKEVLDSFERFVSRVESANDLLNDEFEKQKPLMGADDRWRWRGLNESYPAPCRCDDCKKQGMVRISH